MSELPAHRLHPQHKRVPFAARQRRVTFQRIDEVDLVRKAAQNNKLRLAIVAADVSHNSREKIVPLLTARRVQMIEVASGM